MGRNQRRKKKKMSGSDEDTNINANNIPEDSKAIVQQLKEIVNCSEQEIYEMLLECNNDPNEAVTRLLSQDRFQEVKKKKRDKKKEAIEKNSMMDEREEESSIKAGSREVIQNLMEMGNSPEQVAYEMLVKSNCDAEDAAYSLLHQDSNAQVENREDKKGETEDTLDCQRIGSRNQNHESTNSDGGDVDKETSNVHLAGSSTTSGLSPLNLNSDLTKRGPISSSEAIPFSGQKRWADVVNMGEAKGPVKPLIESAPPHHLREFASASNQNLQDEDNGTSWNQWQRAKNPLDCVNLDKCIKELQNFKYGFGMSECGEEEQERERNAGNEQMVYQTNSNAARNYRSSESSLQLQNSSSFFSDAVMNGEPMNQQVLHKRSGF